MTPEQFRDTRKRLGLTQKGLATALRMGLHGWQTISKWESGATPVPGPVSVAMDCLLNHVKGGTMKEAFKKFFEARGANVEWDWDAANPSIVLVDCVFNLDELIDCLLNHAPVLIGRGVDGVEVAGG